MIRDTSSRSSNQLRLQASVAGDDIERVLQARRIHLTVAQHHRPAEHRVQRSAELMRERGEEFVLQAVGRFRFFTRVAHRDEQVAHVVLPAPQSQRGLDRADDRGGVKRPSEQRDVAEPAEQVDCAQADVRLVGAAEEQNGHVGPRRLLVECLREERQVGRVERFFRQQDRAGAGVELADDRREAVAERAFE